MWHVPEAKNHVCVCALSGYVVIKSLEATATHTRVSLFVCQSVRRAPEPSALCTDVQCSIKTMCAVCVEHKTRIMLKIKMYTGAERL